MMGIRIRRLILGMLGLFVAPAVEAVPGTADFDAWRLELDAQTNPGTPVLLSPAIGAVIDATERGKYRLLPSRTGFLTAELIRQDASTSVLGYNYVDHQNQLNGSLELSNETLRLTRLHIWLSDLFFAELRLDTPIRDGSDALLYTALRFASKARYDLVIEILEDLGTHYADTEAARWALDFLPDIRTIHSDHRVLIWDQTAGLGSGSNDLRFFGSYYGLWLGFALPMALDVNSPEPYGLGLILGGPTGYYLADRVVRNTPISEGRATILSLGANLGTWQGLGWAAYRNAEAKNVFSTGILGGLGGLGTAIWLSHAYEFSEGHAALTETAMNWGAWFGLIAAGMSDSGENTGLRNALIGSAAGVTTTGWAARHIEMSEKQVRMISLKGLLGTVMGFGFNMIVHPGSTKTAWGVIGASGTAGLVLGYRQVRQMNQKGSAENRMTARGPGLGFPHFMAYSDPGRAGRHMPAVGFQGRF